MKEKKFRVLNRFRDWVLKKIYADEKKEERELKVIGIVGPYFGDGTYEVIERNILKAEAFAIALANLGIPFFCSHTHTRHFEAKAKAPESFYKAQDMRFLVKACFALLVVPGWETSAGTRAEIAKFKELGRPVFYPKSPEDLEEILNWRENK